MKETKEIRVSTADPECGFLSRENKQEMFCYLDHGTTEIKFNIITEKIDRSFADSKELHGLRYCWLRGVMNASEQALLTAVFQNTERIATHLARLEKKCVAML